MNYYRVLTDCMLKSLQEKNIHDFHACLAYGFDARSFVPTGSGQPEPFIVKVARSSFPEALRTIIIGTSPCPIDPYHGLQALRTCIATGAPKSVVAIFVEASLLLTFPILNLAESFFLATEYGCETLARQAIEHPGFDRKWCIPLPAGGWERPVHVAARCKQPAILRRVLELGSDVDGLNCRRQTALEVAVQQADYETVFVLLQFGADPNAPDEFHPLPVPHGSLLGHYGIPEFPSFHSDKTRLSLTEGADRIIGLLLEAGFKPTMKYWIRETWVNKHMSTKMGRRLFYNIRCLPSMLESSVISGRLAVRSLMVGRGGSTFNDFVQALLLPTLMKSQLYINLTR